MQLSSTRLIPGFFGPRAVPESLLPSATAIAVRPDALGSKGGKGSKGMAKGKGSAFGNLGNGNAFGNLPSVADGFSNGYDPSIKGAKAGKGSFPEEKHPVNCIKASLTCRHAGFLLCKVACKPPGRFTVLFKTVVISDSRDLVCQYFPWKSKAQLPICTAEQALQLLAARPFLLPEG